MSSIHMKGTHNTIYINNIQLSATDVLASTTMKNAAKCDTLYETQDLVNHQNFERTLHYQEMPGSTPGWVSACFITTFYSCSCELDWNRSVTRSFYTNKHDTQQSLLRDDATCMYHVLGKNCPVQIKQVQHTAKSSTHSDYWDPI